MQKTFYFFLKASFVLKIFIFCPDFVVMYKNGLIRKVRLIWKFVTPHTGEELIIIHILPNISRNKHNQTIRFGQLIEYNMRNIFLEKLHSNIGGDVSSRPFHRNTKLSISLDQQFKMLQRLFFLYVQVMVKQ